jgi:gliding motility-associated protein GldM
MASAKETPRQKMIGMMYLVLTALLALNVSKDILDAFVVVNKGLVKTSDNFDERNEQLYAAFDLAKDVDPKRLQPNWEKAQQVKKGSADLVYFIDKLQKQIIAQTEGIPQETADTIQMEYLNKKDSYDTPTNIMIGDSEDGSKGASHDLKNRLIDFRNKLNTMILPEDKAAVKIDINTEDPKNTEDNENWEMYNFYNRPLVASLTILSKIKNDVKNAESQTVDYLLKQSDGEMLKFDTIAAKVIPQSNYVLLGEEYSASVFLAAFNKTKNPEILVGNYNEEAKTFEGSPYEVPVNRGLGTYKAKADREGIMTYSGTVKMKTAKNKEVVFPFKSEYIVARPALTVSADNMNVVYIGLENPISVSVPGVPNEKLKVSVRNGSLRKTGDGKYMLKVNSGDKTEVSVTAEMGNGEERNMGAIPFRVRKIPTPVAKFGNITSTGAMTKSQILAQLGLIAYYENFYFNAQCKVTSFELGYTKNGGGASELVRGNSIEGVKNIINSLKKNDKIYFENIKAVGPDGVTVPLPGITVKII